MAQARKKGTVTSDVVVDAAAKREAAIPELARQLKGRGRKRAVDNGKVIERQIRTTRTAEARDSKEIERPAARRRWRRASALPQMDPPPGYALKYVRRDHSVQGDQQNLVRHLQEGWEFAKVSDFPGRSLPTHHLTNHGDIIGNDNTILMKMPEEMALERKAYYDGRLTAQTRGVNEASGLSGVSHPAMPLVEDVNKTKVDFGVRRSRKGRPTEVASDD